MGIRKSITRSNRTAFIIMIDQSGSMAELVEFRNKMVAKAELVAMICNEYILNLLLRAKRSEGVRDYYDVLVVGYSGRGVTPLLGEYEGDIFIPITQIESRALDSKVVKMECTLPDGSAKIVDKREMRWIEPLHVGTTPMHEALTYVHDAVDDWCGRDRNRESSSPVIFNITDGIASDCDTCDLEYIFSEIKRLGTAQDRVLMLNTHISSSKSLSAQRALFPSVEDEAVSQSDCRYLRTLFNGASNMPSEYNRYICDFKGADEPSEGVVFKGLGYNTSLSELFAMLNIGSISVKRG